MTPYGEQHAGIIDALCLGSDSQLDESLKPRLQHLRTLEVELFRVKLIEILDDCVYSALASGFVITTLDTLYHIAGGDMASMMTDRKHPDYHSMLAAESTVTGSAASPFNVRVLPDPRDPLRHKNKPIYDPRPRKAKP